MSLKPLLLFFLSLFALVPGFAIRNKDSPITDKVVNNVEQGDAGVIEENTEVEKISEEPKQKKDNTPEAQRGTSGGRKRSCNQIYGGQFPYAGPIFPGSYYGPIVQPPPVVAPLPNISLPPFALPFPLFFM